MEVFQNSKQFWCRGEKTGSVGKLPPPPIATGGLIGYNKVTSHDERNDR